MSQKPPGEACTTQTTPPINGSSKSWGNDNIFPSLGSMPFKTRCKWIPHTHACHDLDTAYSFEGLDIAILALRGLYEHLYACPGQKPTQYEWSSKLGLNQAFSPWTFLATATSGSPWQPNMVTLFDPTARKVFSNASVSSKISPKSISFEFVAS